MWYIICVFSSTLSVWVCIVVRMPHVVIGLYICVYLAHLILSVELWRWCGLRDCKFYPSTKPIRKHPCTAETLLTSCGLPIPLTSLFFLWRQSARAEQYVVIVIRCGTSRGGWPEGVLSSPGQRAPSDRRLWLHTKSVVRGLCRDRVEVRQSINNFVWWQGNRTKSPQMNHSGATMATSSSWPGTQGDNNSLPVTDKTRVINIPGSRRYNMLKLLEVSNTIYTVIVMYNANGFSLSHCRWLRSDAAQRSRGGRDRLIKLGAPRTCSLVPNTSHRHYYSGPHRHLFPIPREAPPTRWIMSEHGSGRL